MNDTANPSTFSELVRTARVGPPPLDEADYDAFARVYGTLFTDADDDVNFWVDSLRASESVCEVGCGTGRITSAICGAVRTVVGIDPSEAMLARATASPDDSGPVYRLGRMESLPAMNAEFDCVIAPRGAFTHILSPKAQVQALMEAARVLKPGGRLILDNPHYQHGHPMTSRSQPRHQVIKKRVDGTTHVFSASSKIDSRWGYVESTYWVASGPRHKRETIRFVLRTKILGLSETLVLLAASGFRLDSVIGDYDGSIFTSESSRLISVATLV